MLYFDRTDVSVGIGYWLYDEIYNRIRYLIR